MISVFLNAVVVTVDEAFCVYQSGCVVIEEGRFTYVGETAPKNLPEGARIFDCRGKKLLMPGFVDGHTHLPMTLFRGGADDMPLHQWLNERIFPMEAKENDEIVYWGALLACAEMLQAGITTVNDMYTHNRSIVRALQKSGMRAIVARGLFGAASDAMVQLADNIALHREMDGAQSGRLRVAIGPHAEYTATVPFLEKCAQAAQDLGCALHIHVSETQKEHQECKQRHGGLTPVGLLHQIGFLKSRAYLAHCVWLEDQDLDILEQTGTTVLHNPCSNMKLASGFARIPEMIKRGIPVALATDGAASNNSLDMWEDMRVAALIHKGNTLDATVVSARQALFMATCGAAQALGLDDVGSIAMGMRADLQIVDIDRPFYHPMTDIVHHIVYGGSSRDVEMTMIDGRIVYKKDVPFGFDLNEVYAHVDYLWKYHFKS